MPATVTAFQTKLPYFECAPHDNRVEGDVKCQVVGLAGDRFKSLDFGAAKAEELLTSLDQAPWKACENES